MSNNTKIFSEAIAEAKAIRETAMTNAKLALEEAFAPRMQEMMSNKLEAMADEDEEMEEGFTGKNGEMTSNDGSMEEDYGQAEMDAADDEISLEELIAELDGLEETSGYEEDPEDQDTYMSNDGYEKPKSMKGVNDPYMEENSLAEAEDEDAVGEITVDELKDIIRSVMNDVMEHEEEEGEEGEAEEEMGEEAPEGEDELNLEEILAELELEGLSSPEAGKTKVQEKAEDNEELEEAMNTIATLRSELNEVNLLNAKLLYVNKLFKSKNLTEAQKVKVINAFDRAETVKETKNIFETLKESLSTPVKSAIKESLSFASKAAGVADRKPIVENNDFVARMQKLAGII
ncbi:hypothetical protein N9795_00250 [Candidatus Pelagibacter sp.]|nr:hypothetical protein [Candidatus Pelagibacter sp.]